MGPQDKKRKKELDAASPKKPSAKKSKAAPSDPQDIDAETAKSAEDPKVLEKIQAIGDSWGVPIHQAIPEKLHPRVDLPNDASYALLGEPDRPRKDPKHWKKKVLDSVMHFAKETEGDVEKAIRVLCRVVQERHLDKAREDCDVRELLRSDVKEAKRRMKHGDSRTLEQKAEFFENALLAMHDQHDEMAVEQFEQRKKNEVQDKKNKVASRMMMVQSDVAKNQMRRIDGLEGDLKGTEKKLIRKLERLGRKLDLDSDWDSGSSDEDNGVDFDGRVIRPRRRS